MIRPHWGIWLSNRPSRTKPRSHDSTMAHDIPRYQSVQHTSQSPYTWLAGKSQPFESMYQLLKMVIRCVVNTSFQGGRFAWLITLFSRFGEFTTSPCSRMGMINIISYHIISYHIISYLYMFLQETHATHASQQISPPPRAVPLPKPHHLEDPHIEVDSSPGRNTTSCGRSVRPLRWGMHDGPWSNDPWFIHGKKHVSFGKKTWVIFFPESDKQLARLLCGGGV